MKKGAIALSYPIRVRVRATAKLSAEFFHDESPIIIRGEVRKCNSTRIRIDPLAAIAYFPLENVNKHDFF